MFYKIYTEKDDEILRSYSPHILWINLIYELISLVFYVSVMITYFMKPDGGVFLYFTLYSYWGNTLATVSTIISMISTIPRLFIYYYNKKYLRNKNVNWWLNLIDNIRDGILVLALLQLSISSGSFWLGYSLDFKLGYPTIMAHSIVVLALIILYLQLIVYVNWWILVLCINYSGSYYNLTIVIYYQYNFWLYEVQDPTICQTWYNLASLSIIIQVVLFVLFYIINTIKNKLYAWIQYYIQLPVLKQKLEFAIRKKEHYKVEIILVNIILSITLIWRFIVVMNNGFKIISRSVVISIVLMLSEFVYFIISCVLCLYIYNIAFKHIGEGEEYFSYIKYLNRLLCSYDIVIFVISTIVFFGYILSYISWLFLGLMILSIIILISRMILEYYLITYLHTKDNHIIYKNFFYIDEIKI